MVRNIYRAAPPQRGEIFETIFKNENVTVEEIVSSDTPETKLYDQPYDEAVFLLQGSATLWIEGKIVKLDAGDYLCIKARERHKVIECKKGTRWLAIHSKEPLC